MSFPIDTNHASQQPNLTSNTTIAKPTAQEIEDDKRKALQCFSDALLPLRMTLESVEDLDPETQDEVLQNCRFDSLTSKLYVKDHLLKKRRKTQQPTGSSDATALVEYFAKTDKLEYDPWIRNREKSKREYDEKRKLTLEDHRNAYTRAAKNSLLDPYAVVFGAAALNEDNKDAYTMAGLLSFNSSYNILEIHNWRMLEGMEPSLQSHYGPYIAKLRWPLFPAWNEDLKTRNEVLLKEVNEAKGGAADFRPSVYSRTGGLTINVACNNGIIGGANLEVQGRPDGTAFVNTDEMDRKDDYLFNQLMATQAAVTQLQGMLQSAQNQLQQKQAPRSQTPYKNQNPQGQNSKRWKNKNQQNNNRQNNNAQRSRSPAYGGEEDNKSVTSNTTLPTNASTIVTRGPDFHQVGPLPPTLIKW